jgi:hypothetical protein
MCKQLRLLLILDSTTSLVQLFYFSSYSSITSIDGPLVGIPLIMSATSGLPGSSSFSTTAAAAAADDGAKEAEERRATMRIVGLENLMTD